MDDARELARRLREHVMGPPICPDCGNTRDDPDFERCKGELQCDWHKDYGTHSSAFDDPWQAKKDMLAAAVLLEASIFPLAQPDG